jgi:dienelactone hydrolase
VPRPAILLTLLVLAGCGGSEVRVTAPTASVNEPPQVRVEGLDAGQTVELHAGWRSDFDGERWTSTLQLRADDDGTAVAGPEVLTAMQPPDGAETEFFPLLGRNRIALDVRSDGETIARGTLVREFVPVTTELAVESDFIAGLYFEPADPGGSPVVVLGGSEGSYWGLAREASALAAAGHPVLSLAYFGEPDLQQRLERVPADLVRVGVKWLRNMTEERQVAVMGVSRGGELALLAASLEPSLAADVVALVPSSRVGFAEVDGFKPAWTWEGEPVEPREKIRVERIRGDILAVGAGRDAAWLSKPFVHEIEQRGRAVRALQYDEAGHAVGTPLPYMPGRPTNLMGGTPEADEKARQDLWPKILAALSD